MEHIGETVKREMAKLKPPCSHQITAPHPLCGAIRLSDGRPWLTCRTLRKDIYGGCPVDLAKRVEGGKDG